MTTTTLLPIAAAFLVLFVPATRTELHNTRESPLREWPVTFQAWEPPAGWTPTEIVTPRIYAAGPRKRLVPRGEGKLTAARTGPLAWAWERLDPAIHPLLPAAGPVAVHLSAAALWGRIG